jgi:hypothetical protein
MKVSYFTLWCVWTVLKVSNGHCGNITTVSSEFKNPIFLHMWFPMPQLDKVNLYFNSKTLSFIMSIPHSLYFRNKGHHKHTNTKAARFRKENSKSSITVLFMHEFPVQGQFICLIMLWKSFHRQGKFLTSIAVNIWGKPAWTIPFTYEENPILSYHIARIWGKHILFSTDSCTQIS